MWESWPCLPPATSLVRAVAADPVDSTTEPTPLAEVWLSQPLYCGHGRAGPITQLSCGGMGRREIVPPAHQPRRGQVGELVLSSYEWESWPCLLSAAAQPCSTPRQYSRVCSEGKRDSEVTRAGELTLSLFTTVTGVLPTTMQEGVPWW